MRRATASVFLLALTLVPLVLLAGCGDSEDYDQHELIFTSPAATDVEVVDSNDDGFERAIVGGTGAYVGARGQVTQTAVGKDEYQAELDFETPRG